MKNLKYCHSRSYVCDLFKTKRLVFASGEAPKVKVEAEEKKEKADDTKALDVQVRWQLTMDAVSAFIKAFRAKAEKDPKLKSLVKTAEDDFVKLNETGFSVLTANQKRTIIDEIQQRSTEASQYILGKKSEAQLDKKPEKPEISEAQQEVLDARIQVNNLLKQAQEAFGKTQGREAKLPVLDFLAIKSDFDNGIKSRNTGSEYYDKGDYSGAVTGYASALARFQDVISQCNRFLPKEEKLPTPWKEKSPAVAKLEEKPKKGA